MVIDFFVYQQTKRKVDPVRYHQILNEIIDAGWELTIPEAMEAAAREAERG